MFNSFQPLPPTSSDFIEMFEADLDGTHNDGARYRVRGRTQGFSSSIKPGQQCRDRVQP